MSREVLSVFNLSREFTRGRVNLRTNEAASFAFGSASGCLVRKNFFQRTVTHRGRTTHASALPHFDLSTAAGSGWDKFNLVWFGSLSTLAHRGSLVRIWFGLGLPLPLVDFRLYEWNNGAQLNCCISSRFLQMKYTRAYEIYTVSPICLYNTSESGVDIFQAVEAILKIE